MYNTKTMPKRYNNDTNADQLVIKKIKLDSDTKVALLLKKELRITIKLNKYKRIINKLYDELTLLEEEIKMECKHIWTPDRSFCDHYTVLICKKCNKNK